MATPQRMTETEVPAAPGPRESARYWRDPHVRGLEMLRATFVTHAFPRHTHEECFVVGAIERGVQACCTKGTNGFFPAGTVVLLNPGTVHTGRAFDGVGYTYRALYPEVSLMQSVARQTDREGLPFFRAPFSFHDPELARRLFVLHGLLEADDPGARLERDTRLAGLLRTVLRRYGEPSALRLLSDGTILGREPGAVARARAYLDANAAKGVSLEELAAVAGLSPFHLLRVFRDTVGVPPHAYQTQARVAQAKMLLGAGVPPAQAAVAAGFVDQSHLTRHFKRLYGVPPGAFLRASLPEPGARESNFVQAARPALTVV